MAANDIGPRIGIDGEKEFRTSLNAINAQIKSLGAEMRAVTAEFSANADSEEALAAKNQVLGQSVDAAKQKLALLDGQLDRQKGKLSELAAELDKAAAEFGANSQEAAKAQNAYNKQYTAVANLERQYQSTRGQIAGLETDMAGLADTAEEATQALGADAVLAGNAGWDAIQTSVRAVIDTMRDAVGVGMQFDSSMSDVAATMGTTVDQLGDMRDFAQEMGASTAFTATEAAQALNYMALAGYDAETAMSTLPTVLNLAAAGGVQLATASDMITDAQSALGLSLEETTRLVDEMAQASTKTNTSVEQLGGAILEVGGTAKFMAGGTREITQVLGILADNSIKGAEGGTKLRNIIFSLTAPTDKAASALERLGVDVFDKVTGNMREFSAVFPELQAALSRLTSQEQIEALSEIFNSRDIAAAQALLGTTVERWDELADAIDGAQGSAERMAQTRLDNLAGDITLMQSAADGARIALSDSLTPALRDLTQAGTGVLTFVGGFIGTFPLAGQAAAGLAAAGVTLGVGMAASAAEVTSVTGAVTALTGALAANPFGQMALAVGLGVTALTALAHAADEAERKTTEAAQAVEDSREAWEAQGAAAAAQREDIEALAIQLEDLSGRENRTAGEKARLLEVTERLNAAVPGLGLSYDQFNDTLSMTTEQVLALARAQADIQARQEAAAAVVEAERAHTQAVRELSKAQDDLAAAISARADAEKAGLAGDFGSIEAMQQLRDAVKQAQVTVAELEGAVADSEAQIEEMSVQLEELSESAQSAAEGVDESADAIQGAADTAADAAVDLEELEAATLYVAGAADTLSDALKEQEKSGSLSLKTTNELIDAGYASAIAIDEETGAVTINRAEYERLAGAKIQAQIASLEASKADLESKRTLDLAAEAAARTKAEYWELAKATAARAYAEDVQALDLQIAALNRAQAAVGSYSAATTTAARRSSSASKKIKTQAEQDLEDYKAMKAQLDHEKAMDLIDEAEYYQNLTDLRDQYLTDVGNLSEYNKVSESIYKADQAALANREKLWQTASDNILKLEEDFQKEISSRAGEIVSSYRLFEEVPEYQKKAGTELIANLESQIGAIQGFYDNIAALEERGVGADLVNDIRGMGVKASGELEGLLELTDEQLSRYSELYGEKQELANRIAMEELEALRAETNEEILGQLEDVAELYETNGPALGLAFANSLAQGMFEGLPAVEDMSHIVARAAMSAFEQTYNRDVEAMMTASGGRSVTRGDIGELLAGAVNGINTGGGAGSAQPMNITLQTRDGIEIARAFLPDIRTADRESPMVLDDT